MKKNQFIPFVVLAIFLFSILNASITSLSTPIQREENDFIIGSNCGINLISDPNLDPCYVMEHFEIPDDIPRNDRPNTFATLPSSFSWKSYHGKDYTTPAKSQGNCGSCWAFAAVSCFESLIDIAWDNPSLDIDLSEQYILSCLPQSGSCNGGWSSSALNLILSTSKNGNYHNGLIPEDCMPYRADDSIPCSNKCDDWEKKLVPLADYGSWNPTYPYDIDAIKTSIMMYGPVVTAFYATGDFARWGYENQEPNDYYPYVPRNGANHAVIIVGWRDDSSIDNGGYWIVKNSWGQNWGYDGFFNIEYGSLNIDDVDITWAKYDATPLASFSHNPKNADPGDVIEFIDESLILIGEVNQWEWDFGDGSSSTEQNPSHIYDSIGTYVVTLTVSDAQGHENILSQNVYVGDDVPPSTTYNVHGFIGENNWYTSLFSISLNSVDTFSGLESIWYNLDGQGYKEYTGRINFYNMADGEHTLRYYAIDNSSNVEDEKIFNFKTDRSDPVIKTIKPDDHTFYFNNIPLFNFLNRTVIIGFLNSKYDVYDNQSGISKLEFYLDGKLMKTDTKEPYSFILSGRNVGRLSIVEVIAYDYSGRTAEKEHFVILSSLGFLGLFN